MRGSVQRSSLQSPADSAGPDATRRSRGGRVHCAAAETESRGQKETDRAAWSVCVTVVSALEPTVRPEVRESASLERTFSYRDNKIARRSRVPKTKAPPSARDGEAREPSVCGGVCALGTFAECPEFCGGRSRSADRRKSACSVLRGHDSAPTALHVGSWWKILFQSLRKSMLLILHTYPLLRWPPINEGDTRSRAERRGHPGPRVTMSNVTNPYPRPRQYRGLDCARVQLCSAEPVDAYITTEDVGVVSRGPRPPGRLRP